MAPKTRTPADSDPTRGKPQPGREGKVQLKAWVAPEFRKRLKALAVELDTPMEALLIQQLEVLLKKHGK